MMRRIDIFSRNPEEGVSAFADGTGQLFTVGRKAEVQKLQDYAARRIHTLVLGPAGVGKSHLSSASPCPTSLARKRGC